MDHKTLWGILLSLILLFGGAGALQAAYGEKTAVEDEAIGVRKKGVSHNIAGDRRVERIAGGLYEPEGLDIYLKRHIDRMSSKIEELQKDVAGMKKDLSEIREMIREKAE